MHVRCDFFRSLDSLSDSSPILFLRYQIIPQHDAFLSYLILGIVKISDGGNPGKVQRLFVTTRSDFTIYYKVRRAVVQDNDDVVQLINNHSKSLRKIYGDFYIAELILEPNHANRQVIVAEYDGIAVAVMILNGIVNYDMINNAFKLETFYGLRKPHPDDMTKVPEAEQPTADGETLSMVFVPEQIEHHRLNSGVLSSRSSSESFSSSSRATEDDFELPTDVAADLEIIIGQEDEFDDSYDDSLSFFGTLEDQVTCVMLSYTDEEFGRWAKKNKSSELRKWCLKFSKNILLQLPWQLLHSSFYLMH